MFTVGALIKQMYSEKKAEEELNSLKLNRSASLYSIVNKSAGSSFDRIHGFGIVHRHGLGDRWSDYLQKNKFLNEKSHGMIVIETKSAENKSPQFEHFCEEAYVLEGLAHCFRDECNEKFITDPGLHPAIDSSMIQKVFQNLDLLGPLRESIIKALEKNEYVRAIGEMKKCRMCGYEGGSSNLCRHSCPTKKALDAITSIHDLDISLFPDTRCEYCGESNDRARDMRNQHKGLERCIVLKARKRLLELTATKPHFFHDCSPKVDELIELFPDDDQNGAKTKQLKDKIQEIREQQVVVEAERHAAENAENERFSENVDQAESVVHDTQSKLTETAKSLNKQGIEKFKNKKYEDALELYFKAIGIEEVGNNDLQWLSKVWNNVSVCWSEMKRIDKALEAVEKAIVCNSSNATYFYGRGTYYKKLGDREKATTDFKKALDLDPDHTNAKKSLAKLEKKK